MTADRNHLLGGARPLLLAFADRRRSHQLVQRIGHLGHDRLDRPGADPDLGFTFEVADQRDGVFVVRRGEMATRDSTVRKPRGIDASRSPVNERRLYT
jgi:hypothetical protein